MAIGKKLKLVLIGTALIGFSSQLAFAQKFIVFPELPGGIEFNAPLEISDDGLVVIGRSSTGSPLDLEFERAYVWTELTGLQPVPVSPGMPTDCPKQNGTDTASTAAAISATGSVIRIVEYKWCKTP